MTAPAAESELLGKTVGDDMTKTKINMMNKENLVKLATQNGIENAKDLNGNTLKKELISYYNL